MIASLTLNIVLFKHYMLTNNVFDRENSVLKYFAFDLFDVEN